jgi:hypothetical protein
MFCQIPKALRKAAVKTRRIGRMKLQPRDDRRWYDRPDKLGRVAVWVFCVLAVAGVFLPMKISAADWIYVGVVLACVAAYFVQFYRCTHRKNGKQ